MNLCPPDRTLAWIETRLGALFAAPGMWGSAEAVEMQVMQLWDLRHFLHTPRPEPRAVLDRYVAWLGVRYPRRPKEPLHEILMGDEEEMTLLVCGLRDFDLVLREGYP